MAILFRIIKKLSQLSKLLNLIKILYLGVGTGESKFSCKICGYPPSPLTERTSFIAIHFFGGKSKHLYSLFLHSMVKWKPICIIWSFNYSQITQHSNNHILYTSQENNQLISETNIEMGTNKNGWIILFTALW